MDDLDFHYHEIRCERLRAQGWLWAVSCGRVVVAAGSDEALGRRIVDLLNTHGLMLPPNPQEVQ